LQQVRMDTYLAYRGFRQEQRQEKAGKPLSKSSLHDLAVTLKSFFKWCVDTEKLSTNPLAKVKIGKPSRQEGFCPTLPQVEAMLRLAEPPLRARLAVLAMTGMRAGELQRLRPEDVDMKGNWIHIRSRPDAPTKTGQSRKVPIHPLLRPILEQQLHESAGKPWLFCAEVTRQYPKGDHCIDVEHLNTAVQRVARRADIQTGRADRGMVTHSLRHFLKTHAMYAGVPEPIRDAWLGHKSDDRPGNRYLHVRDDESQRYMKTLVFTLTDLVSESDSNPNER
jgi:integrase